MLRAAFPPGRIHVLERGHLLQRRAARFDHFGDRLPSLSSSTTMGSTGRFVLETDFLERLQIGGSEIAT